MNATALNLWLAVALAVIVILASVVQLRAPTAHLGRRAARPRGCSG